jgi:hypothetical protein
MEENKDFYKWYKTKITENLQDPPEDAWQNISDELDTNAVWERIAVKLDAKTPWYAQRSFYYSVPLLLLLLLSGGLYIHQQYGSNLFLDSTGEATSNRNSEIDSSSMPSVSESSESPLADTGTQPAGADAQKYKSPDLPYLSSDKKGNDSSARKENSKKREVQNPVTLNEKEKSSETEQAVAGNVPVVEPHSAITEGFIASAFDSTRVDSHLVASPIEEGMAVVADDSDIDEQGRLLNLTHLFRQKLSVNIFTLQDSMLSVTPVSVTLHPDSLSWISIRESFGKLMHSKTFEVGMTASVGNTWLLNRTTFAGLEKHTMNTTLPDFGKDIGLVFCYNFSPRFSAQAEGMFLSQMGQRYKEYRHGRYVTRDVDLNFYGLNLLLKYNRNKIINGQPLNAHGLLAGFYAGALKNAVESVSGEVFDVRAAYARYDYGVLLGYEYNQYLTDKLVLASGLRVNYGFANVHAERVPKTATGSFDFNLAVKYRIDIE